MTSIRAARTQNKPYDAVVLACPIEYSNVRWEFSIAHVAPREFVTWFVTQVVADRIDPVYFGLDPLSEVPDDVLTTEASALPFAVVSIGTPSPSMAS